MDEGSIDPRVHPHWHNGTPSLVTKGRGRNVSCPSLVVRQPATWDHSRRFVISVTNRELICIFFEEEDIEVKLRRIIDCVPVRVNNTSGSSAGSGSGDFHQYRQMRRREQDRLARMDVDFQKRKEVAEFNKRREERLKATEERTAKKRLKRQKKKQKKQEKKMKVEAGNHEESRKEDSSENEDEDHDSGNEE
ncbi:uncharacterized protein LOC143624632 [Bidens hawaiensis]|uniref:uncharacterized protein LOC143624632 n=1 Tax=Bidens hawaiensis TaxID=980011 RepID=UPI0040490C9F